MAKAVEGVVLGELLVVKKTFTNRETGETRDYNSYELHFDEDTVVRFNVRQEDRSLLEHLLKRM